jgi:hypothetical protein
MFHVIFAFHIGLKDEGSFIIKLINFDPNFIINNNSTT